MGVGMRWYLSNSDITTGSESTLFLPQRVMQLFSVSQGPDKNKTIKIKASIKHKSSYFCSHGLMRES